MPAPKREWSRELGPGLDRNRLWQYKERVKGK